MAVLLWKQIKFALPPSSLCFFLHSRWSRLQVAMALIIRKGYAQFNSLTLPASKGPFYQHSSAYSFPLIWAQWPFTLSDDSESTTRPSYTCPHYAPVTYRILIVKQRIPHLWFCHPVVHVFVYSRKKMWEERSKSTWNMYECLPCPIAMNIVVDIKPHIWQHLIHVMSAR